jgi:hypothetical protein
VTRAVLLDLDDTLVVEEAAAQATFAVIRVNREGEPAPPRMLAVGGLDELPALLSS